MYNVRRGLLGHVQCVWQSYANVWQSCTMCEAVMYTVCDSHVHCV